MKSRLSDSFLQDLAEFWGLLKQGDFRTIFAGSLQNSVVQLFRYALTGGSTFLVDFLLLFILGTAGVPTVLASGISFTVGIICNFLLTKFFAFKSVTPRAKGVGEVAVFAAISGGGLVLTMLLMHLFANRLGLYFMLAKLISSVLVFFWNFLGRKFILYPRKRTDT